MKIYKENFSKGGSPRTLRLRGVNPQPDSEVAPPRKSPIHISIFRDLFKFDGIERFGLMVHEIFQFLDLQLGLRDPKKSGKEGWWTLTMGSQRYTFLTLFQRLGSVFPYLNFHISRLSVCIYIYFTLLRGSNILKY